MTPDCERMVKIGNSNHIMKSIERKVVPSAVKKVFLQHRADPTIPFMNLDRLIQVKHTKPKHHCIAIRSFGY
jgi:hypothetical protein